MIQSHVLFDTDDSEMALHIAATMFQSDIDQLEGTKGDLGQE